MLPFAELRRELEASVSVSDDGAADRLCVACVEHLDVDGASISLWHELGSWGTFGCSGELSRRLDEFQFTFGEGPCLDAVAGSSPVMVADLSERAGARWPAFTNAVLGLGVRGVFAMPVMHQGSHVGALDLYRRAPGSLDDEQTLGGLLAADIASGPVRDLMTRASAWPPGEGQISDELALLGRVEIAQATGMIIGQLEVDAAEALLRLRAYAFAHDMTASEAAWSIVERRLRLDDDHPGDG